MADSLTRHVSYRDLFHLAADLRAMGEGNAMAARPRHPARRGVFLRAAAIMAESFADGPGRVRATFDSRSCA